MNFLGDFLGVSKQVEVLVVILIGVVLAIFDESLFYFRANLKEVWSVPMNVQVHPIAEQLNLKYILSGVILIRTFTLHIFLALYIVMLWPALFEDKPNLILPWLAVGLVRNILTNVVTLTTGCFVCLKSWGLHVICLDFVLAQIIDHGPAIYAWLVVAGYYQELKSMEEGEDDDSATNVDNLAARRRSARYMSLLHLNITEKAVDPRNFISESTIENIMHYLEKKLIISVSRSLDTLLDIKAAEAEREQILNVYEDASPDEDEDQTIAEKFMNILNITEDDILQAKRNIEGRSMENPSDWSMDTISFTEKNRGLSTTSSESFFMKYGKFCREQRGCRLVPTITYENLVVAEPNSPALSLKVSDLRQTTEAICKEVELNSILLVK